jgi:hypothetical protein
MDAPNIPQTQRAGMTVGSLRFLLEGLDDMTPIGVEWERGYIPNDHAPAVRVFGFQRERFAGEPVVKVLVGLQWMDEEEDE